MPKRICIFCFYDPAGIVDEYITYLLDDIKPLVERFVIVCNCDIENHGKSKFLRYSDEVIVRENLGFDGGAYQEILLNYLKKDELEGYDEIILMNDTFFGPFCSFDIIFDKMKSVACDMWGLSLHEKYMSDGKVRSAHIQSYFIVIKRNVFLSGAFWDFWSSMKVIQDFNTAVGNFEISFSEKMLAAGFILEAYCRADRFVSDNAEENYNYPQSHCGELIRDYGFPILKRKCLVSGYLYNDSPILAMEYIKAYTSYNEDLIWDNLLRRYDMTDIRNSLALQYIIDEGFDSNINSAIDKVGLIIFIYNKRELQNLASYKGNIPHGVKIYYLGIGQEIVPEDIYNYGLEDNFEIRNLKKGNVEQVIFLECQDIFQKHEYLCVLSGELGDNRQSYFRQLMINDSYESCLKNISQLLSLFQENSRLGVLFPSSIRNSFQNWDSITYTECKDLCERNGIAVRFQEGKRIFESRTSFWCRTKTLRKYIPGDKFKNFTEADWKNWIRCLPYIFQADGYYCGYISTVEQSRRMIAQDEQEIQEWVQTRSKYNTLNILMKKLLDNMKRHIYIYGCGIVANRIYDVCVDSQISIESFIISDTQEKAEEFHEKKVIWLSEYVDAEDNLIIVGVGQKLKHEIMTLLDEKGYQYVTL